MDEIELKVHDMSLHCSRRMHMRCVGKVNGNQNCLLYIIGSLEAQAIRV